MSDSRTFRVLFVDLDGTLILDNSFHLFLWAIAVNGDLRLRGALFRAFGMRLLARASGRESMKRAVLRAFSSADKRQQQAIVSYTLAKMSSTVSRPVMQHVTSYRNDGWRVVLATAAPCCYARPFAVSLGFDDCLASPEPVAAREWKELIGARKADACLAWAHRHSEGTTSEIATITDHLDDLPLLKWSSQVVIQASKADADLLIGELPDAPAIKRIDPVAQDNHGGMWLWINDAPSGPHDIWEVKTILSKHRYALLYRADSNWGRVEAGHSLGDAALRSDCPRPPSARERLVVAGHRVLVRDVLGVYH
ncbi:HAD family hydrolase [Mycolicibacterium neoaurum]|uniref:HAD family hydrolase n=1 Tax=Mycolicibacterium neoaurum TaxID=1795 RepID=UPI002673E598|nr:HAD family hydrolase [Mycolicibacterium neoaurum]MDO3400736.1 HAD family hydrolase [Mycolicibacterium neoaurum]